MKLKMFICIAAVCLLAVGCGKIEDEPTKPGASTSVTTAATTPATTAAQTTTVAETEEVTTVTTEQPEEDPLGIYADIIRDYTEMCNVIIKEQEFPEEMDFANGIGISEGLDYEWSCMVAEILQFSYADDREADYFGYALIDLNNDGKDELILLTKDYFIFAIFTEADGMPKLVGSYWSRNVCVIYGDGIIFTHGSGGAAAWGNWLQTISKSTGELETIKIYGGEDGAFYEMVGNDMQYISEEEYNNIEKEYSVPQISDAQQINREYGMEFIPVDINKADN